MKPKSEPESSIVVVTGGIGSGKSTVSRMFESLGARVISADELAHEVLEPGHPAYVEVLKIFGRDSLSADGTIDRRKLGAVIFADPGKRKTLEAITHPHIRELSRRRFNEALASGSAFIVYECPLFFEAGLDCLPFRAVITVLADDAIRIARASKRLGLSPEETANRMKQQMPLQEKARRSHFVLENNSSLADLEIEVKKLWQKLGGG